LPIAITIPSAISVILIVTGAVAVSIIAAVVTAVLDAILATLLAQVLAQVLNTILLPLYAVPLPFDHVSAVIPSTAVSVIAVTAVGIPVVSTAIVPEHGRAYVAATVESAAIGVTYLSPAAAGPVIPLALRVDYPGVSWITTQLDASAWHSAPATTGPAPDLITALTIGTAETPAFNRYSAVEIAAPIITKIICESPGKRQGEQNHHNGKTCCPECLLRESA
jgi:hypothetical protein